MLNGIVERYNLQKTFRRGLRARNERASRSPLRTVKFASGRRLGAVR